MKTTLDLPDDLLAEAKAVAARRHITLKVMVEHALRREIQEPVELSEEEPDCCYEENELGFLVLKKRPGVSITAEMIQKIQDDLDEEEFNHALKLAGKL